MAQTTAEKAAAATEKSNGNGAKTSAGYDDLSNQIASLKADVAGLTDIIGKIGKSEKDRLVAAAQARGEDLKAAGEARYAEARERAEGYLRDGERYIREQPGTALGIAAGLGFVIGYMMSSRR